MAGVHECVAQEGAGQNVLLAGVFQMRHGSARCVEGDEQAARGSRGGRECWGEALGSLSGTEGFIEVALPFEECAPSE